MDKSICSGTWGLPDNLIKNYQDNESACETMSELDSKELNKLRQEKNDSKDSAQLEQSIVEQKINVSTQHLSGEDILSMIYDPESNDSIPITINNTLKNSPLEYEPQKNFNINLKYLFIAVVYLKLRSDLYTNIGDRVLEIGINDIIDVYGKGEICQGKLGRYIDYVKAVVRDNKLGLTLEIPYESRQKLNFLYYDCFVRQTLSTIKKNPNSPNFTETKLKSVFDKIYRFFDGKENCLKNRKIRHFSCAIFYISLRLIDISITLQELVVLLQEDPMFSKMLYYSVSRINRDICDEFVSKFLFLI